MGVQTTWIGLSRLPRNSVKLSSKLSSGLDKAGKALNTAKELVTWVQALNAFAGDAAKMKPTKPDSVTQWIESMKRFWNASMPFAKWVQNQAAVAAIAEGSAKAAAFSTVLVVVGSELFIGIAALDAGVKVVDAYFKRMDQIMKEIDPKPVPEPPPEPGEWMSEEEQAEQRLAIRKYEADKMKTQRQDQAVQNSKEEFDKNVFPGIYKAHRAEIVSKIKAAVAKSQNATVEVTSERGVVVPEDAWEECLIEEADVNTEIDNFHALADEHIKPCPFFEALYDAELKRYLAKGGKK